MRVFLVVLSLVCAPRALAVTPIFDLNLFYFSDTLAYNSATKTYSRTVWDFTIAMPVTKKGQFVLGWNYGALSFIDNPATAETLTISDMGPKFIYYIDKQRTWVVALVYNLITKATYNPGTSTEMRGTSMRFEAGYTPHMTENLLMGAKLNYYKASFTEEITGQTALAKVTNGRTVIYPTFAITYRFD